MFRLFSFCLCLLSACTLTSKPIEKKSLGTVILEGDVLASLSKPGKISFRKIVAGDWEIDRRGLIDLNDPKAEAAGLSAGPETVQSFVYVLDHPTQGRFLIDSGISQEIKDNFKHSPVAGIAGRVMNLVTLKMRVSMKEWMAANPGEIKAVFFTHMHADHLMGIADLPEDLPLYAGPGEASQRNVRNVVTRFLADDLLAGNRKIFELNFPSGSLSMLDIFDDQSFFAIWVPGHTAGSLAFLVNSTEGPQLLVGDSSHTRWGWENNVSPGLFSADREENRKALNYLRQLASKIPGVHVHLGHQ